MRVGLPGGEVFVVGNGIWMLFLVIGTWIVTGGVFGFLAARWRGYPGILGGAFGSGLGFVILVSLCLFIARVPQLNALFF